MNNSNSEIGISASGLPTKIVVIGAGSNMFGLNTLATILRNKRLQGSELALVDINVKSLDGVYALACRLNKEWSAKFKITKHTNYIDALPDAKFVIQATEVGPRHELWQQDYEITLKHGVRQPYGENGGPGGFAHAARNIIPILEIARDMQNICPDALMINFSNPMARICDVVNRFSTIRVVGLCHQIGVGYALVAKVLADYLGIEIPEAFVYSTASISCAPARKIVSIRAKELLDIKAAGVNHFTWMFDLREKATGKNLYPLFREKWNEFNESFEPLTRRVFDTFGYFPIAGDEHMCEYLPWVNDPITKPWEKYQIDLYEWDLRAKQREANLQNTARLASGPEDIDYLKDVVTEGASEVIENVAGGGNYYWLAANVPNNGYINNLPHNAIIEVPAIFCGAGVLGVGIGSLPIGIAELCRRAITINQLCVDSVVHGDFQLALQCMSLDPMIRDLDVAKAILEDYLTTYREYLPTFWK